MLALFIAVGVLLPPEHPAPCSFMLPATMLEEFGEALRGMAQRAYSGESGREVRYGAGRAKLLVHSLQGCPQKIVIQISRSAAVIEQYRNLKAEAAAELGEPTRVTEVLIGSELESLMRGQGRLGSRWDIKEGQDGLAVLTIEARSDLSLVIAFDRVR
jgi:hypothetical protein